MEMIYFVLKTEKRKTFIQVLYLDHYYNAVTFN
jgi:hypothetical protein